MEETQRGFFEGGSSRKRNTRSCEVIGLADHHHQRAWAHALSGLSAACSPIVRSRWRMGSSQPVGPKPAIYAAAVPLSSSLSFALPASRPRKRSSTDFCPRRRKARIRRS
ncbi:hypothetical protein MTO96_027322 [Rhipicephalus appendiculatus]